MAFTYTRNANTVIGNKRLATGTFTQGNGDTGGDIDTGLENVESFQSNACLSSSDSSGTVTMVTADPTGAQTGYWQAIGL